MNSSLKSNNLYFDLKVLGGFIALSLVMRFFSFFPTIISHDEGTYFVLAREMLLGKIYFVDLVDTKPIGFLWIIAGIFRFIAPSIFLVRMLTAVVIAFTSFTIYKISMLDQGEKKPAIAAGAMLIFLLSIFTQFGVFVNNELYYIFFSTLGFYTFLRSKKLLGFLATGLLLGIGFTIKYVVLFDLAAWLMFYFFAAVLKKDWKNLGSVFVYCVVACVGFIIPFGLIFLYYYQIGHLKEFLFYTFEVTGRIPVERTLWGTIVYIGDFHLRFLPVIFFFYYALIKSRKKISWLIPNGLVYAWCVMVLLAVIAPGKPFGHYFIQMMIPVCIIAGRFFNTELEKPHWLNKLITYPVGSIIVLVIIIGQVFMQKHDYYDKPDVPKQVAEYLKPMLKPEDRIYTGNYQQVLYFLLSRDCPVKYVHRTLMCNPGHQYSLQVDLPKEMNALMKIDFEYILMQGPYCYEPMNEHVRAHYQLIKEFGDRICLYKRK